MDCRMIFFTRLTIIISGLILVIIGIISSFYWTTLLNYIIRKELHWSPNSRGYESWRHTSSVFMKIYMFNWTNPSSLDTEAPKPEFQELGPYVFRESIEKVNITWNSNATVSYLTNKTYYFEPELSNGTLDDLITSVNAVSVSSAYVLRSWNFFVQKAMSFSMSATNTQIHVTKTVREMLFDGFEDPILNLKDNFKFILATSFNKVGWFVQQNGSTHITGYLNVATGEDDISHIGQVKQWNYNNTLDMYTGACSVLTGRTDQWAPGQRRDNITLFAPGLKRFLRLRYQDEHVVHGLKGYRYVASVENMDNGTLNAENSCYCTGECVPSGVMNASVSTSGGPVFISYPHFYLADPYFEEQVIGMNPERERHQFSITLEPVTGVPIHIEARMQTNMLVDKRPNIVLFKNTRRVFIPCFWVEEYFSISPDHAAGLRMLLRIPHIGSVLSNITISLGILLTITVIVLRLIQIRKAKLKNAKKKEAQMKQNGKAEVPLVKMKPSGRK